LPDGVAFLDQLPRNATGKILKTALRQNIPDLSIARRMTGNFDT
jgi:acyl-coenzyme A synthetase/AMP-(fatty) acid ligase